MSIAVGFYSLNASRDPGYRTARRQLEAEGGPSLPGGWTAFARKSRARGLAYETRKRVEDAEVAVAGLAEEVARIASSLVATAAGLLAGGAETDVPATRLEDRDAPVSIAVADDFELKPLEGDPRVQGSIWKARILWALEWARRHDPTPKSAADIARILSANGVSVPPTNTARAFRNSKDDPRCTGLCEEPESQRYVISSKGRRALFELMVAAELEGAQ